MDDHGSNPDTELRPVLDGIDQLSGDEGIIEIDFVRKWTLDGREASRGFAEELLDSVGGPLGCEGKTKRGRRECHFPPVDVGFGATGPLQIRMSKLPELAGGDDRPELICTVAELAVGAFHF